MKPLQVDRTLDPLSNGIHNLILTKCQNNITLKDDIVKLKFKSEESRKKGSPLDLQEVA